MKHFLWYDANGEIRGVKTRDGGFSAQYDPGNGANFLGFVGWIPLDCPCSVDRRGCPCVFSEMNKNFVSDGALVAKLTTQLELDGNALDGRHVTLDKKPGESVRFRLLGALPDGYKLALKNGNGVQVLQAEVSLEFTAGASQAIALIAPTQGMTGRAYGINTKLTTPFSISLRGWNS